MHNTLLWFSKTLFLSHFALFVHATHLRSDQAEIDRKIEAMRRRLFGDD